MSNEELISYINKIPTQKGLEWLFKFSKTIFNNHLNSNGSQGVYECKIFQGAREIPYKIGAWNINYIAYYLIKFSNDEKI